MDVPSLEYFIHLLKEISNNEIKLLIDRDLKFGSDLNRYMSTIWDIDAVIILLTPSYKSKVVNRIGGVYREFSKIISRYYEENDKKNIQSSYFRLIPILFSGEKNDSVPDQIKDILYCDFKGFTVATDRNGNYIIPDYIKLNFKNYLEEIYETLKVYATVQSDSFNILLNKYYNDLFVNNKTSEETLNKIPNYLDKIFIRTAAFTKVENQLSYFIIGRKGSGKSTIAIALPKLNKKKYNGSIVILADNIDLKTAYNHITDTTFSDLENYLPIFNFFDYTWQGFLTLCLIELLIELYKSNKLNNEQKEQIPIINSFLIDFQHHKRAEDIKNAFFQHAISKLQEFIQLCFKNARTTSNSTFLTDTRINFNLSDYLDFLISKPVSNALKIIVNNCQKRVLVTLDDFDTIFDTFRRNAKDDKELYSKANFEINWLRSLLLLIIDIKDKNYNYHPFFSTMNFCITIPKDRYSEIVRSDRDGYRYNNRTCNLLWSGIDLCELLIKRLEILSANIDHVEIQTQKKFDNILEEEFNFLPRRIEFEFNGKKLSIHLFTYVLRHTFWRPRDVLLYFSKLLATASAIKKSGKSITSNIVRSIISLTTDEIIKTEFIDEYNSTLKNIREIINCFMECRQVITFGEIEKRLSKQDFYFSSNIGDGIDLYSKIEFLYDIGFLGIYLNDDLKEKLNIQTPHAFYFNEGLKPFISARKSNFKYNNFIIHPVFSENLQLDHSKNDFLLNYDWDYLVDNHIILSTTSVQI